MRVRFGGITRRIKKFFSKWSISKMQAPIINAEKNPSKKQILNRGTEILAGLESELKNPDALLEKRSETLELYDTLMLDDRIHFSVNLKKTLALSVPSKVVPASDDPKDVEIAELCQDNFDQLNDPTWNDIQDNLLDSMVYGFKVGEITWKEEGSKYWWDRVVFEHPVLFDFRQKKNKALDYVAYGYQYGETTKIPAQDFYNNFIYMVYPYMKDGNFYGDSELREIYFQWWSKYNIVRWRNVYLQNYGMPIPVAKYVRNEVNTAEITAIEDTFNNWQDKAYLMIPGKRHPESKEILPSFEVDWVELNSKSGTQQYESTIESINRAISWKLLIPSKLGFTTEETGSWAMSRQTFDILIMGLKRIQRRLEEVINPKIKQFVDLNFPNVENYPTWEFEEIDEGLETEMLKMLLEKGVIDKREGWIRAKVGVPELSEKEQAEIDEAKEEDVKKQQEQFERQGGTNGFPNRNDNSGNNNANNSNKNVDDSNKFKAGNIDFKKIETQYDTAEADFVREYNEIMQAQSEKIIKQVERKKIVENKDYNAIKTVKMSKTELKRLMSLYYAKLYFEGKASAIDEVSGKLDEKMQGDYKLQIDENDLKWLDRGWIDDYLKKYGELGTLTKADREYLKNLRARAFEITGENEDRVLKEVYHAIDSGIRNGETTATVISKIREELADDRKQYATTIARTNASDAFNTGRMNLFMSPDVSPFIEAFQYSAILDGQTTEFCRAHDGQIIKPSDPEFSRINPPNHYNCRSLLISIMVGEDEVKGDPYYNYEEKYDQWGQGISDAKTQKPASGFGG